MGHGCPDAGLGGRVTLGRCRRRMDRSLGGYRTCCLGFGRAQYRGLPRLQARGRCRPCRALGCRRFGCRHHGALGHDGLGNRLGSPSRCGFAGRAFCPAGFWFCRLDHSSSWNLMLAMSTADCSRPRLQPSNNTDRAPLKPADCSQMHGAGSGGFEPRSRDVASAQRAGTIGGPPGKRALTDQLTSDCSRPCRMMSRGRSIPMNTSLLWRCSCGPQAEARSLPMSWCTPWNTTLRSMPCMWSTPL